MRVVVTAAPGSLEGLEQSFERHGAEALRLSLLSFAPPETWEPVDESLTGIASFAAVAVTSPRAAAVVAERIPVRPCRVPAWAAGQATAAVLRPAFDTVLTAEHEGEGAASALAAAMLTSGVGSPVLFPCGSPHRRELIAELEARGVTVRSVTCYRTVLENDDRARAACRAADVLVVTSPTVARLLAGATLTDERPRLLAVGPTTAEEARLSGWPAAAVAETPTVPGILKAFARIRAEARTGRT